MQKIYPYLTFAGALPCIAGAACIAIGVTTVPLLGETMQTMQVYLLIIASFMAGSHWGQHLHIDGAWSIYLPVLSNAIAVFLWIGAMLLPPQPLLVALAAAFLVLLRIDTRLFYHGLLDRQYFRIRCQVTVIVVTSILVATLAA